MNRLSVSLTVIVVLLSFVSGFLFYQNSENQNLNSELRTQNSEIQNQLDEQQMQNRELENQITNLQNKSSELDAQILELENQTLELQNQIDQLTQLTKIRNSSIVVRVTNFTTTGVSFGVNVGVRMEYYVNITIQNLGTNNLEGLTLTIDQPVFDYVPTQSFKIESLNAGEERTVSTKVDGQWGAGAKAVIRIKLDDIILDEYRSY